MILLIIVLKYGIMRLIIIVLYTGDLYMRKFVLGLAIALAACNIASAKEYITLESQLVILSSMKKGVGYWAHMITYT